MTAERRAHVPESRFGKWFLRTDIWETRVLDLAIDDLDRLIEDRAASYPVIVDVGCGAGQSLQRLRDRFAPELIVGLDIDFEMLGLSALRTRDLDLPVVFVQGTSADIGLAKESVDMLFCHQTFHHLPDQQSAIREFHRVLKPGGLLLFAESTRAFIHSWIIRLLFRHPMDVQKSADEYREFIEQAGFDCDSSTISYPYLWWSRADLGLRETLTDRAPPEEREETLLNLVAVKRGGHAPTTANTTLSSAIY
jgi:ubiquinone/menaquinone biosynthesis C-methylase UbiE